MNNSKKSNVTVITKRERLFRLFIEIFPMDMRTSLYYGKVQKFIDELLSDEQDREVEQK